MANKLRAEDLRVVETADPAQDTASGSPPAIISRSDSAIDLEDVTLHYPVGPVGQGSLKSLIFGMLGQSKDKVLWGHVQALRNVNLTIRHGERVGIIGRNGAGKSTFLRTLAGVYPLKAGRIRIVGRIGTLLELGHGFEVEATGRENIYYRGMAMGYSRKELRAVEQDIVDFADLGEFIDLPVRTYSSGMYVRLGFAISTQMDPDILLIDEVFGAGDAGFAKRAVKRMQDMVQRAGIMVIATHDLRLISNLCTRVLWVNEGEIVRDGSPAAILPQFTQFVQDAGD